MYYPNPNSAWKLNWGAMTSFGVVSPDSVCPNLSVMVSWTPNFEINHSRVSPRMGCLSIGLTPILRT